MSPNPLPVVSNALHKEPPDTAEICDAPTSVHHVKKESFESAITSDSEGPSSTTTRPTEYTSLPDVSVLHLLSADPESLHQESELYKKGPYSLREIIGIALLAAKGVPWTAAQVQRWIADNFFKYQKVKGSWEKSVATLLSSQVAFKGKKMTGQMAHMWSFANATHQEAYEKLYAKHPALASTRNPPIVAEKLEEDMVSMEETISQEVCSGLMPFERVEDYPALQNEKPDPNVRRESNFFRAFPQYARPSIETMSEEDIQRKIEEIKRRPNRKTYFGAKLHPARLSQRDTHDERTGTWQPIIPIQQREDAADEAKIKPKKSLKELLELPENPIPIIYDGQLAFRDGTLVNGRIPRSRVIYKPGKVFGGELRL
ncbi:hypothetical protein P280DRAFT_516202 [Massarina eburnea CBS 473.64]|uniref:Fork-head domain-containing protein n=1 Tax=Massarina eburnea CBS 473.64 TaxID=1395130 RepID=A0A6A6S3M0_9PLEO|nr:hypothetical protein P280DRAFT_516202 [Massarina eburnea CBS 473.64]